MKSANIFTSKVALVGGSLAIASAMFSAMPAYADSITFDASPKTGDPAKVKITLDDTTNPGKITVKVDVITDAENPNTADINGVYFNVPSGVDPSSLVIEGSEVNQGATDKSGSANNLGDGVNMNGGGGDSTFSVGVRIGVSGGINGGDDYQTTTFTLSGAGLSLSDFTSQAFGVRLKSVGPVGSSRNGSSKVVQTSPETVVASSGGSSGGSTGGETPSGEDETAGGGGTPGGGTPGGGGEIVVSESAPEPLTIAGTILGGGAIAAWRKRKGNKNAE